MPSDYTIEKVRHHQGRRWRTARRPRLRYNKERKPVKIKITQPKRRDRRDSVIIKNAKEAAERRLPSLLLVFRSTYMQIITDENTKIENNLVLPVLALRGLVFFPGMMLQFDVGRKKSILAVSEALSKDRLIFLVTQIDLSEKEPRGEDLYKTGVIARIKQVMHHSEEGVKLHVEGICRGRNQLPAAGGALSAGRRDQVPDAHL